MSSRTRRLALALLCALVAPQVDCADRALWHPSQGHEEIRLWPNEAPDEQPRPEPESYVEVDRHYVAGKPWHAVMNVAEPTMTVYPPKGANTGAAIVVFPGGGYNVLAIDLEGTEICDWVVSKRMTCVLLKYRVPHSGPQRDRECRCEKYPPAPWALQDAQRAMRLLRHDAKEYRIDPNRIGVIGFSAGGHLVADVSTHLERAYPRIDDADDESSRPDFAIALYPGHLWTEPNLDLNASIKVTPQTPPTFLLHADNDPTDNVKNTLVYFAALKENKVPTELHVYARGGHAFGLRPTAEPITRWPALVEKWLETIPIRP